MTPLLLLLIAARAATLTVGEGEGYDYNSVSEALETAGSGDLLQIYPGTYGLFDLKKDVTVEAAQGLGTVFIDGSEAAWQAITVRDGTLRGVVLINSPSVGYFVHTDGVLQGCEVRDAGQVGVYISTGSPTISEVLATGSGQDGFLVAAGTPTLVRSIASDGTADGFDIRSDGLYANLLALRNSTGFRTETAISLSNAVVMESVGPAIEIEDALTLSNAVLVQNTAAMDCNFQSAQVLTSLFWEATTTANCDDESTLDMVEAAPGFTTYGVDSALPLMDLRPEDGSPLVDVGTGTDAQDGSQADMGLFGGPWGVFSDDDGDGYAIFFDCDDQDGSTHMGAEELPDGLDNDCDGQVDEGIETGDTGLVEVAIDLDGDGFSTEDGDCDDHNLASFPGASERVDGADNDCDGQMDEGTWAVDDDGDGYTEAEGDCDDTRPDRHPGADDDDEDGVDDDCDGADDAMSDADGDGDGYSPAEGDCDDTDANVNPDAWDGVDGVDSDCDGTTDGDVLTRDLDVDGLSMLDGDCDDEDISIAPTLPEAPDDFIDQDCDGTDLYDQDEDGDPAPASGGTDCDDLRAEVYPGAPESCDGLDNDCDGKVDELCQSGGDGDLVFQPDERLVTARCNCSSPPGGGGSSLLPLLLLAFSSAWRRRRRTHRRSP